MIEIWQIIEDIIDLEINWISRRPNPYGRIIFHGTYFDLCVSGEELKIKLFKWIMIERGNLLYPWKAEVLWIDSILNPNFGDELIELIK